MKVETFTPTQLQSKLATVFNSVQSNGEAAIKGRSRPDMVLMLRSEKLALLNKIFQLTEAVKKLDGDAHKQKDLLK